MLRAGLAPANQQMATSRAGDLVSHTRRPSTGGLEACHQDGLGRLGLGHGSARDTVEIVKVRLPRENRGLGNAGEEFQEVAGTGYAGIYQGVHSGDSLF